MLKWSLVWVEEQEETNFSYASLLSSHCLRPPRPPAACLYYYFDLFILKSLNHHATCYMLYYALCCSTYLVCHVEFRTGLVATYCNRLLRSERVMSDAYRPHTVESDDWLHCCGRTLHSQQLVSKNNKCIASENALRTTQQAATSSNKQPRYRDIAWVLGYGVWDHTGSDGSHYEVPIPHHPIPHTPQPKLIQGRSIGKSKAIKQCFRMHLTMCYVFIPYYYDMLRSKHQRMKEWFEWYPRTHATERLVCEEELREKQCIGRLNVWKTTMMYSIF